MSGPLLQRWLLVCRVVDNLGDAAVMWRLARQLAAEHALSVSLHIDEPEVLRRLVPGAQAGSTVDGVAVRQLGANEAFPPRGADVVVSGFHAPLPTAWPEWMTRHGPVWINLEYLSAEPWVDDFHGLPSPRSGGLVEHFFYPGFSARSGGLLRERDLLDRRDRFVADPAHAAGFLADLGVVRRAGETLASLLCYPHAPLLPLARALAAGGARLHLLVPDGVATDLVASDAGARLASASQGRVRTTPLPFLPQADYDALLWSCDLNFVRGEDSWIRAIWSGRPFVWQVYPQAERTHLVKLEAFLDRCRPEAGLAANDILGDACRWWNDPDGTDPAAMVRLVADPALADAGLRALHAGTAGPDLATRLVSFAGRLRRTACRP
jgi:uncharacterized repeat protein (TIGR03837 family)